MSNGKKEGGKALAARPGYEVGYGKPPKETQFRKGQSGNPRGRPKGAKNKRPGMHEERMKDIILDEAYRGITVRDGDRNVTIPMAQAIVRSMAVNAAKGQHRAQRLFSELLASVESSRKLLHDEFFENALTYKLAWEKELTRREALGVTHLDEPIVHPDQIVIDMRQGTARLVGPVTKEEKAIVAEWRERIPRLREAVDDLKVALIDETDPEERDSIEASIRTGEKMIREISPLVEGKW